MLMEMDVADNTGKPEGWVQLDLDYKAKTWAIQEGTGFDSTGFAKRGTFEVKSNNVIWLMDRNTAAMENMVIIWNPPLKGEEDPTPSTGKARIYKPLVPRFADGIIQWKLPELAAIRKEILRLAAAILPESGVLLEPGKHPMTEIDSRTHGNGETNCYMFPGYITKKLDGNATARVWIVGLPDGKGNYKDGYTTADIRKGTMAIEQLAQKLDESAGPNEKKLWVPYEEGKRPLPGDFYVLEKTLKVKGQKKELVMVAHVGVIIDTIGDIWRTADSGQGTSGPLVVQKDKQGKVIMSDKDPTKPLMKTKWGGGMQAGYRERQFNNGTLMGEDKKMVSLKGWIDIDNPRLFPKWATK